MSWDSRTGHSSVESDRVHGRPVFDHDGVLIGKISRLLIDRRSGSVEEVVVHTQGRFGFGRKDLSVSWHAMQFDTRLSGYRVNLRFAQVLASQRAPAGDARTF